MYYNRPMDGAEIAEKLGGMSRQAVSNTLKRAMKKFYNGVRELDETWTPFECVCVMMKMFGIPNDLTEIKKFFNLFPPDIKSEVTEELIAKNGKLFE